MRKLWLCLLTALLIAAPAAAADSQPAEGAALVQGSAEFSAPASGSEISRWQKHYEKGRKDYHSRLYTSAQQHILESIKEARRFGWQDNRLVKSRNALAELYCSQGRYTEAQQIFDSTLSLSKGSQSIEYAQSLNGLAAIALARGNFSKSESLSRQALAIREKLLGKENAAVGQSLHILAMALAKQSWLDEAGPLFARSIAILEKNPGSDDFDLADGLRDMALFYQAQGKTDKSAQLFTKAITLKERSIRLDMPPAIAGVISFPWDEGSPGSGQIVDGMYPLKYMTVGGLRIAATVVQSMNLIDILISLKNTTDQAIDVGVGPVNLSTVRPKVKQFERFNPDAIDWVLEENTVWDWTHRQPSLAILQQNTIDPGSIATRAPACKECPGGNVWGRYGRWDSTPASLSYSTAKNRARSQIESILMAGEVKWDTVRALDMNIVRIGPNESRSGLVYFANPHFGEAILRIFVGNTSFDFPFRLNG
jgi:tetratricopeptide (TPR) repeat protein